MANSDNSPTSASSRRQVINIMFENCFKGLGIKIMGGYSTEDCCVHDKGVFIKRLLGGGLARRDGRLEEGDEIISVNGDSFKGVSNTKAVALLRTASASGQVDLVVSRDEVAKHKLLSLLDSEMSSEYLSAMELQANSCDSSNSHDGLQNTEDEASTPKTDTVSIETDSDEYSHEENLDIEDNTSRGPLLRVQRKKSPEPVLKKVPNTVATQLKYHPQFVPTLSSTPQGDDEHYHGQTQQQQDQLIFSHRHKDLSIENQSRVKVEKLQVALNYLGLDPTPEQRVQLQCQLLIDGQGTVSFGDFVSACREIFHVSLDELNVVPVSLSHPVLNTSDVSLNADRHQQQPNFDSQKVKELEEKNEALKLKVRELKKALSVKQKTCSTAEKEVLEIRKEKQEAVHQCNDAMSKLRVAEESLGAAREMEVDYEEVVGVLEGQLQQLKNSSSQIQNIPAMQKQLAVLSCQLKKAEFGKKTYEVSTEKLLHFAEMVHESCMDSTLSVRDSRNKVTNHTEVVAKRHKPAVLQSLSTSARDIIKVVNGIITSQPLPFGWEEVYTQGGVKYYTNHVTQNTSWQHPLSTAGSAGSSTFIDRLPETET